MGVSNGGATRGVCIDYLMYDMNESYNLSCLMARDNSTSTQCQHSLNETYSRDLLQFVNTPITDPLHVTAFLFFLSVVLIFVLLRPSLITHHAHSLLPSLIYK